MEELAHAPGELDLGAAGELLLGERGEDAVRDRGRGAHASSSSGSLIARSRSTIPVREIVSTPPSRSSSLLATVRTCASIAIVRPASRVARSPITARAVCSKRRPSSALAFWA